MSIFPTQQEIIDGLTYEVERLKKENQKLKSLISSKNNDLLGIGDVINQREQLKVFLEQLTMNDTRSFTFIQNRAKTLLENF